MQHICSGISKEVSAQWKVIPWSQHSAAEDMFLLSEKETQAYFIQISLASFGEESIPSCVRLSLELQTFNCYIYFWSCGSILLYTYAC